MLKRFDNCFKTSFELHVKRIFNYADPNNVFFRWRLVTTSKPLYYCVLLALDQNKINFKQLYAWIREQNLWYRNWKGLPQNSRLKTLIDV